MAIEIETGGLIGGGGLMAGVAAAFGFFKWRQEAGVKRDETTVGQYITMVNALQLDIVRLNAAREADAVRYAADLASIRRRLDEEMERRTRDWEDANQVRNGLAAQLNHVLKWCATQGYTPPEMDSTGSNLYPSLPAVKPAAGKPEAK